MLSRRIKFYLLSLIINIVFLLVFFSSLSIVSPRFTNKKVINISLKPAIKRVSFKSTSVSKKTSKVYEKTLKKKKVKKKKVKIKKKVKRISKKVFKKTNKKRKTTQLKKKNIRKIKKLSKNIKKVYKRQKKQINFKEKTNLIKKRNTSTLNAKEETLIKKKIAMIAKEKKLREEVLKELQKLKRQASSGLGKGKSGKKSGSGTSEFAPLNSLFLGLVKEKIENNFSLPIYLKKRKDLVAIVKVKVDSNGKILEMKFLKHSKFKKFNELVKTCLKISQPLPVNRKAVIIIEFKGGGISNIK
ncbi:MAG: TonB C-terminal domain-containing protein [Thermodesulfobacteria bacterium]|nr:TonB C-terminal domain-containing protein [Thermodesulfobacteriota bacterium]